MFKWLVALLLFAAPAAAQGVYPGGGGGYNTFCFTQANGTNNNTCASTAFVQNAWATPIFSGLTGYVYANGGSAATAATTIPVGSVVNSATPLLSATNTWAGGQTFSNYVSITNTTPYMNYVATGAGVDSKNWESYVSGTTYHFGTNNDAFGSGQDAYTITRSANVPNGFNHTTATTLAAGTTTLAPLKFQSGTNLTAATAGVFEYDGTVFYASPQASNRGVVAPEYFVVLTSSNTLTNGTSAQPVFDGGGGPTNGRITLPTGTYFFDELWDISGLSGSAHTISTSFGGTATIGTMKFSGTATDSAATIITGTAATAVQVGSTGTTTTTLTARWSGIFTVTVTGTVIPQITMGTNAAAANVLIGSHLRIRPVGTSSVTTVGNWD